MVPPFAKYWYLSHQVGLFGSLAWAPAAAKSTKPATTVEMRTLMRALLEDAGSRARRFRGEGEEEEVSGETAVRDRTRAGGARSMPSAVIQCGGCAVASPSSS